MGWTLRRASLLAVTVAFIVMMTAARAGTTFDGTFMRAANGLVEYFALTHTGSQVAGFVYSVVADPSAPNGVKETRINVSGVTDGGRVNFRQGQGAFSTTLGWIGRPSGDGFDLSYQANGGYLVTNHFRSVSSDDLNRAIVSLRRTIYNARAVQTQMQQRAQVQAEYYDAMRRLKSGVADRPPLVTAIMTAKQSIRKAQQQQATANDAFTKANAAVDEAERNAEAAAATAQTADDRQHASDLRQVTSDRRQDVSNARQQLSDANFAMQNAQGQLTDATRELARFDERVRQLQQIAQRDKAFLNGR